MITKKLAEAHKRLNDVKGTERKFLLVEGQHINIDDKKFIIDEFYSLNWIADQNFITGKGNFKVELEKFKHLCYGMPTKELREIENSWKELLAKSILKDGYVYIAYYIGGNNDIIVGEVGKLTKVEFESQIKFIK